MSVTSSSSAPVTTDTTRWPVYATKAACLLELEGTISGGAVAIQDVLKRLSNTDTTSWTDKGSRTD